MVFPKPTETAILTIDGNEFRDWETVSVRQCLREPPFYTFRFTCSEGLPLAANVAKLQILPGMFCTVTLAGQLAVTGLVSTRQVFYDARRHYIEIQGSSNVIKLSQSSVISKTFEFKDVSFKDFATKLIAPFPPIQYLEKGGSVPSDKFPRISIPPGQSVMDALEEPLRVLGGAQFTSDVSGNLVVAVGPSDGSDTVTEGGGDDIPLAGRILEGREIIYNPGMADGTYHMGQLPGSDDKWGADVASVPFIGQQFSSFISGAPQVAPLETPVWQNSFLKGRADSAQSWQTRDQVTVFVKVQGWLRPSGGLWAPNQFVTVVSPMLVMDGGVTLMAKSVTFSQDDKSGTITLLELMNEFALGGFTPQGPGGG